MSDKLSSSVLDGIGTRPLSDFSNLESKSFKAVRTIEKQPDKKITPLLNPDIKVTKIEDYDNSVNELVKSVVVRAKVEAGRSNSNENIARYNHVVDYAINNFLIDKQELEIRYQEEKLRLEVKNDVETAESVLKKVDSIIAKAEEILKNIESFQPESFEEIYFVGMKLEAIMELKLDPDILHEVQNALIRIKNVISDVESKIEYNKNELFNKTDNTTISTRPLSFLSGLFKPYSYQA